MKLDGVFVATRTAGLDRPRSDEPNEAGVQRSIVHNIELRGGADLYHADMYLVSGKKISVPLMPGVRVEASQLYESLDELEDVSPNPSELTFAMPTGDEFVLRRVRPNWQIQRFLVADEEYGGLLPAPSLLGRDGRDIAEITNSGKIFVQCLEVYVAREEKFFAMKTISGDTVVSRFDTQEILEDAYDDESGLDFGRVASEESNPDAIFVFYLEGQPVVELERVHGYQLDEILGFDADFGDSLIELVLGHLAGNPIGSLGLPVPGHLLRVAALFVEASDGEKRHCLGVELWIDSHGDSGQEDAPRLVARRGLEGWTANDCDLAYEACLQRGINDPESLDVERLTIRPHLLRAFLRLFDRVGGDLSWEEGKLFGKPSDHLVSREDLPLRLLSLLTSSLETPSSEWESYVYPDSPFGRESDEESSTWKVLEGVLKTGLFAPLDTLLRALDYALIRVSRSPAFPREPWVSLNSILRKRLARGQSVEVVWQSRFETVLHRIRFEFREQSASIWVEILSPEQPYPGWDRGPDAGWEPIAIGDLGENTIEVWEELTAHLNFPYLESLGFEAECVENGGNYREALNDNLGLSLRRSSRGTLAPVLAAQLITRVLQGQPGSSADLEIRIQEKRFPGGWYPVWFADGVERNRQRFENWLKLAHRE